MKHVGLKKWRLWPMAQDGSPRVGLGVDSLGIDPGVILLSPFVPRSDLFFLGGEEREGPPKQTNQWGVPRKMEAERRCTSFGVNL